MGALALDVTLAGAGAASATAPEVAVVRTKAATVAEATLGAATHARHPASAPARTGRSTT